MAYPGSSLGRTQTKTSWTSSRPSPRPRSPPSINPAPSEAPSVSSVVFSESPHRRPSITSFISLRRKSTSGSQPYSSSSSSSVHASASAPPSRPPLPRLKHAPSLDSLDGSELAPRLSDKANRLLGKPLMLRTAALEPRHLRLCFLWLFPHRATFLPGEDDAYKDDECFTDNLHIQRESTLLSPIEFACSRPPSIAVFTTHPPEADSASELDVAAWSPSKSITPVAALPPSNFYAPASQSRPDTPFMDTIVAVNSQTLVARGSHTREPLVVRKPSVVRTEPSWVGEWNQDDMQDVIQSLRSLK
ncbi:hypothetical protein B0H10DRAFT_2213762 [Mycena sp. CBHHK59/15]|nr:hypothetical protein B0H10DRAFT_2213762 [Mycena sp. CBHHK59/15]